MEFKKFIGKIICEIKKFGLSELCANILYRIGILDSSVYLKKRERYYSSLNVKERETELKEWYYNKTGEKLNLEEPENFSQKIQWLKLYDSTEQKTKLADKYLVREWVKEKIGEEYLIPLLGCWNTFEEIDFDKLPNQFVLKATHGCEMNLIIQDKLGINLKEAEKKVKSWMKSTFGWNGMELQYINITRKIIAEEYIEQMDGNLFDYKVHCFNGKPKFIHVIGNRNKEIPHIFSQAFYDITWNEVKFACNVEQNFFAEKIERPEKLEEMIEVARILSEEFAYVRVDLYIIKDQIKFGELTFTPAQGIAKWDSLLSNKMVGSWIDISDIKEKIMKRDENT